LRGTISLLSFEWLLFDFGERAAIVEAANQAAAEDRMKRGIGTAIEVAQARQATAQARLVMIQATGAAQNAYFSLVSAMGISPLAQIKVADVSDRRLSPEMAGSVDKVIFTALARGPDILAAYAAQKASLAGVRAAEAAGIFGRLRRQIELRAQCGVVGAQRFDLPGQAFDRFRLRKNEADNRFLIERIKRLAIHSQLESTRDSAVKLSQRRQIRANSNCAPE
jgi:hypothetical protein